MHLHTHVYTFPLHIHKHTPPPSKPRPKPKRTHPSPSTAPPPKPQNPKTKQNEKRGATQPTNATKRTFTVGRCPCASRGGGFPCRSLGAGNLTPSRPSLPPKMTQVWFTSLSVCDGCKGVGGGIVVCVVRGGERVRGFGVSLSLSLSNPTHTQGVKSNQHTHPTSLIKSYRGGA